MAELTQLNIDGVFYNLHDTQARADIAQLQEEQSEIRKILNDVDVEVMSILDEVT